MAENEINVETATEEVATPQSAVAVTASVEQTAAARARRKERVGKVISDKMDKTVVVTLTRKVPHPLYKKYFKKTSKFVAHDEKNDAKTGDTVRIMETRPLSKTKRWRLIEVLERAK